MGAAIGANVGAEGSHDLGAVIMWIGVLLRGEGVNLLFLVLFDCGVRGIGLTLHLWAPVLVPLVYQFCRPQLHFTRFT